MGDPKSLEPFDPALDDVDLITQRRHYCPFQQERTMRKCKVLLTWALRVKKFRKVGKNFNHI